MVGRKWIGLISFAVLLVLTCPFAMQGCTSGEERRITAGDVVDRESLKSFVEGARDYLEGIETLTEVARLHDVLMEEGEWKSGSRYLIVLLRNGAVLIHGEDPVIENKLLIDVKDDLGKEVVKEILAAAARGGDFVEYHWDDPSVADDPILKACYAVEFSSGIFAKKLVVVGGYHQDVSDMAVEHAMIRSPDTTADEVVDRESLKSFVQAAANTYREAILSDDDSELPHVQNAFKVEGGDWKKGPVYLFIMSSDGYVLLHAADLTQEGRTLIDQEDTNGFRFIRGLIVAAEAGGGFVEYYWDNPVVRGDEQTGSPKVSYAEGFALPGQDQLFVVGAGIYTGENGPVR